VELQRDCHKKDAERLVPWKTFLLWAMALVLGVGLSQDKGQGHWFGKREGYNWGAAAKGLPKEGVGCKQNCPLGTCSPKP